MHHANAAGRNGASGRRLRRDGRRHLEPAPGGLPQTAFLCEQLRDHYPDLLIIVSRWGGVEGYDDLLVELRRSGASYLTTSLQQTVTQLKASAPRLHDASAIGVANA